VPTQLHRILDDDRATRAAAQISHILLGGAAISPALLDRADEAGLAIVRTYGMSETAGGCVYDGVPFDGVDITITEAGTIDLRGPVVADAYVDIDDDGTITPIESAALTTDEQGAGTHAHERPRSTRQRSAQRARARG
jgi:O-succinylbenzoic acid--CoA ligase